MLSPLDSRGNRERGMSAIRPARARAPVRYLGALRAIVEGTETALIPGAWTIIGRGKIVL
jgi:TPP-dependent trihydroxycyclohexane-1,2-dione (THcHDO) dehydratase